MSVRIGVSKVLAAVCMVILWSAVCEAEFLLPPEVADKLEVVGTYDYNSMVFAPRGGIIDALSTISNVDDGDNAVIRGLMGIKGTLFGPGEGGLSEGKIVKVREGNEVDIYRVYTKYTDPVALKRSRLGGWWTFDPPGGNSNTFRHNYGVCTDWNHLDMVVKCKARAGAVLIVGPGESVRATKCKDPDESYPGSRYLQVYAQNVAEGDCEAPDKSFTSYVPAYQ